MADDRSAEQILSELPTEFRAALEANERLRVSSSSSFAEWDQAYGESLPYGDPFRCSYLRLTTCYPDALSRMYKLLLPIQAEYDRK